MSQYEIISTDPANRFPGLCLIEFLFFVNGAETLSAISDLDSEDLHLILQRLFFARYDTCWNSYVLSLAENDYFGY